MRVDHGVRETRERNDEWTGGFATADQEREMSTTVAAESALRRLARLPQPVPEEFADHINAFLDGSRTP